MQINVRKDQNLLIVSVDGRMDTVTAPDFQQRMQELLNQGETKIIMDFNSLEYVSSAGLRSILVTAKKAKAAGGAVACCGLQRMVKKVFDVSGFSAMILVYECLEECCEELTARQKP